MLETVGLAEKEQTPAGNLNLIDKKRLELARALATNPRLLLLDEVIGGLNSYEVGEAIALIDKLRKNFKLTILWIEHVMKAIMQLSDRILVLDQGKLICEGTPEEVSHDARVIRAYLGDSSASSS